MGNVIWSPELFLNMFGSTLLAKIRGGNEKMSTCNVQRIQKQWLQMECKRLSKDLQLHIVQVQSKHKEIYNEIQTYKRLTSL